MMHRLREAMRELNSTAPMGGEGKTVEMDETLLAVAREAKEALIPRLFWRDSSVFWL
jgi:hypothetical protein